MHDRHRVLVVGCHPDDIEINMSGTLLHLKDAGCEITYMTLADGSCGTESLSASEIVSVRANESKTAAAYLDAEYLPSLAQDMLVFYGEVLLRQLTSVIRKVRPTIILTQSLEDYMEDHMVTARLVVSAAFARGMVNFRSAPDLPPVMDALAIYHAMPHGLCDPLRRPVTPDFYVDVTGKMEQKKEMLALHASQKQWLDRSQGFESYIETMTSMTIEMGTRSRRFNCAEGWRRHLHLGFSPREITPLEALLEPFVNFADKSVGGSR